MGIVWEAYHKGVPLLGVPGITLDENAHKVGPKTSITFLSSEITPVNSIYNYSSRAHLVASSTGD